MKEEYPAPDNSTVDDTGIVTINVPAGSTPPPNNPPVNPPPSADTTLPVVTAFVIPSTSTSLTIPITTFTATDNVGVVGYKITEIAMKPSIDPNTVNVASVYNANQLLSSGWTASAPTTYTFGSIGSKTLYAWAIDSAGNVSNSVSRSITVTSPPLPNSAPVLAAIGNKTVNENSAISFVVSATDTNNDILTYSVSGLPSGAVFNSSTKTFSWTPSYTQSGIYTVMSLMSAIPREFDEVALLENNNKLISYVSWGNKANIETARTFRWEEEAISLKKWNVTYSFAGNTKIFKTIILERKPNLILKYALVRKGIHLIDDIPRIKANRTK